MYEVGVDSFTLCHYENDSKVIHGHRCAKQFIQGQNMIGIDIDGTETIDTVKSIFAPYTYCLYTTKSHQTVKRDYKDSFRVLPPTKNVYYVTPEMHKEMYKNLCNFFEISSDIATYNVSRIWFTNKNAEVFINDGELLDVSPFMPDTDKNVTIKHLINDYQLQNKEVSDDEIEKRIYGMIKYAILTIEVGNLKNTIFRVWKFIMEITNGDRTKAERALYDIQEARGFPMSILEEFLRNHRGD